MTSYRPALHADGKSFQLLITEIVRSRDDSKHGDSDEVFVHVLAALIVMSLLATSPLVPYHFYEKKSSIIWPFNILLITNALFSRKATSDYFDFPFPYIGPLLYDSWLSECLFLLGSIVLVLLLTVFSSYVLKMGVLNITVNGGLMLLCIYQMR